MKEVNKNISSQSEKISSEMLAALIIDALVDAKLIKKENFETAVKIAEEEINVRRTAGDY